MRHGRRVDEWLLGGRRSVAALVAYLATMACGPSDPQGGSGGTGRSAHDAVVGGDSYVDEGDQDPSSVNGCGPFDRSVIRQAAIYMRTVSGFTDYFRECLREGVLEGAPFLLGAMIGPYVPCPMDPFSSSSRSDQLQQAFTTRLFPNPQIVGCGFAHGGGGATEGADIGPWGKSGADYFEIAQTQIDEARSELELTQDTGTLALIAGLMLHETYHNQGYLHNPPSICPGQSNGTNDMPDIVQMCIQKAEVDRAILPSASCLGECRAGGHVVVPSHFRGGDGTCACEQEPTTLEANPMLDDPPQKTDFSNAATDATGSALASGNFDGDFYDDLAVAVPGEQKVEIYYGTVWGLVRLRDLTEDAFDETEAEDRFGAALAVGDFDDDGFDDLAVGAPGENDGEGRVYVYRGSRRGLKPAQTLSAFGAPRAGDHFGEALAFGFDGDRRGPAGRFDRFIVVGAPGRSGNGATLGSIDVFVDRRGRNLAERDLSPFSEVAAPADATASGEFGAALASGVRLPIEAPVGDPGAATATDVSIVVGAPGAALGRGAAYLYDGSELDHVTTIAPKATLQIAELSEGARFGSALAFGPFGTVGPKIFVGSPGAGRVDRFPGDPGATNTDEHEATIWGSRGRSFGATLAGLKPSGNLGGLLFVGAPGDDGSAPLGGFVAVYGTEGGRTVEIDRLTQALMSTSDAGDRFGAALAFGNFDHDPSGAQAVAVGAPGDFPSLLFDAPGAGAVFTFKQLQDPCGKFLGWKTHTDSGLIRDTVSPSIPAQHLPFGITYKTGDRVVSDCDVFEALVDDPGSDLTDPSQWRSLDLHNG